MISVSGDDLSLLHNVQGLKSSEGLFIHQSHCWSWLLAEDLAEVVGQNTHMWSLYMVRASTQHSGWVPMASVLRERSDRTHRALLPPHFVRSEYCLHSGREELDFIFWKEECQRICRRVLKLPQRRRGKRRVSLTLGKTGTVYFSDKQFLPDVSLYVFRYAWEKLCGFLYQLFCAFSKVDSWGYYVAIMIFWKFLVSILFPTNRIRTP